MPRIRRIRRSLEPVPIVHFAFHLAASLVLEISWSETVLGTMLMYSSDLVYYHTRRIRGFF